MITDINLPEWSFCILNTILDLVNLSILELFGCDLDNTVPVHLGDLVGNDGVTHFLSDMTIVAWTSILSRFRNPFLPHLLLNVIYFFLFFIFNSTYIHAIFSFMTKFSTSEASYGGIFSSHVMFNTIHSNVSKFSTVVISTPSVVVLTEYCFHNFLCWIEWLGSAFWCFVTLFLAFATLALKF